MNLIKAALLACLCARHATHNNGFATALQILSPATSSNEISRRSAVSSLIASSTAAIAGAASPLLVPPFVSNADGGVSPTTSVMLNSSNKKLFPLASFGLQVYDDDKAYKLTLTALEVGYRNFFASVLAGNQKGFAKVSAVGLLLFMRWYYLYLTCP